MVYPKVYKVISEYTLDISFVNKIKIKGLMNVYKKPIKKYLKYNFFKIKFINFLIFKLQIKNFINLIFYYFNAQINFFCRYENYETGIILKLKLFIL